MHPRFGPGQLFPDFALPDHTDTLQRLSDLQGDEPLLVVLIRGSQCPKDREQLKDLTRLHTQRVMVGCGLVVITTDDGATIGELRQQLGADYAFLTDAQQRVRDELDIVTHADDMPARLIPHTVLLAAGLRVHKVWCGAYHWGRPSACELHDALRELSRDGPAVRGLLDSAKRAQRAGIWQHPTP